VTISRHGDVFVLPGATVGAKGGEAVLFQTTYESEHRVALVLSGHKKGTKPAE
jgi:hypothetical protein